MVEQTFQIHLFYPLLFILLAIAIVTAGIVLRGKSGDKKDTFIFAKSSDNAKDVTISVTNSMKEMHGEVVEAIFTPEHEKEFHAIERKLMELEEKTKLLDKRVEKLES